MINFKWLNLTDLKASGKVAGADGKSANLVLPRNARQVRLFVCGESGGPTR